ncbi:MAG: hypothetical protein PVG63_07505 [Anaerolineales bacterium]|jgi:hypothetical protein
MSKSSFWEVTFARALTLYANVFFAILWIGLAVALMVNPEWLDTLWIWVRGLPLIAEIVVWVFFLPMMVGLWIWTSAGGILVKVAGLAGLVGWTLVAISSIFRNFGQVSSGS